MYSLRTTILLVFLFSSLSIWAQGTITFIENVNVIPMHQDTLYHNQRVIVEGSKIIKIEPSSMAPTYRAGLVIDGTNKFLIPGLVEMHYHLQNNPENELKLLIANGITTVRNMAEYPGQDHISIRNKVQEQEIIGPAYFTTGPYLKADQLKTEEEVEKVVKIHMDRGYDYLKIADNLPKEIYLKLHAEAWQAGIQIVGHAQRELPLEYSLRIKSIEHVEEFMYLLSEEQKQNSDFLHRVAEEVKISGAWVAPTLGIFEMISRYADDGKLEALKQSPEIKYLPIKYAAYWMSDSTHYRRNDWFIKPESLKRLERELQWQKKFTKILSDHKVPLLAGSDTYGLFIPGFSLHHELELINSSGLTPYQTLLTATVNPARYLNTIVMDGTISEGKLANFILLDKSPLHHIRNTQTIQGVMLRGQWFSRKELDKMLEEVEADVN